MTDGHERFSRQPSAAGDVVADRTFRVVLEQSTTDALLLLNERVEVVYATRAAERLFAETPWALRGTSLTALVVPEDRAGFIRSMQRLLRRPGESASIQFRCLRGDGLPRWIEAGCTNLLGDASVRAIAALCREPGIRRTPPEESQSALGTLLRSPRLSGPAAATDFFQTTVEELVRAAGLQYVGLYLARGPVRTYRLVAESGTAAERPPLPRRIPPSRRSRGLRTRREQSWDGLQLEPAFGHALARWAAINAVAGLTAVPIRRRARCVGMLVATAPSVWDAEIRQLLDLTADFVQAGSAQDYPSSGWRTVPHGLPELLDGTEQGIMVIDRDCRCLAIDRRGAETFGVAPKAVRGANAHRVARFQLANPRTDHESVCPLRAVVRSGRGIRTETDLIRRTDRVALSVDYTVYPLILRGRIEGTVVIFSEALERRPAFRERDRVECVDLFLQEATAALVSSPDLEEALQNVARVAVAGAADWCAIDMIGEDGVLHRIASAHSEQVGTEFAMETWRAAFSLATKRVVNLGASELHTPDQTAPDAREGALEERSFSSLLVPLRAGNSILGVLSLVRIGRGRPFDSSDLKVAQQMAARIALVAQKVLLSRNLEESNRLKDAFLATVSHELRTPLNSILGWATLLRARRLDAELMQQALTAIEQGARSQARLIDELLDTVRIVSGKIHLERRDFDLRQITAEAADAVRPDAEGGGLVLEVEIPNTPCVAFGDPHRLQQVLWNLATNAVKFTPAGGLVRIALECGETTAVVSVSDTGTGIAPEALPHIFERFRQAEGAIRRGGLGLGLSIARHLVELHGGSIRAESEGVGHGATFIVKLPRHAQHAEH